MAASGAAPCVFCDIVAGDEISSRVYEDATVLAFMDLYPVNPGHTLIVPKRHAVGLADLDVEVGAHMWRVGHHLARALRRTSLRCEGVNVLLADGEAAFQEVFHTHLHVFPRFAGDTFRLSADQREHDRASLDTTAAELAGVLAADLGEREVRPTRATHRATDDSDLGHDAGA
jgi:histidine triad (HIT) family protein